MAKKVGNLSEDDIKGIGAEANRTIDYLSDISKVIARTLKSISKETGETTDALKESFSASKALSDAISKADARTLASRKEQAKFQDKVRKAQEEATRLEAKARRLKDESINLTQTQAKAAYRVARAYEDGAEKLRDQAKAAGKIVEQFEILNNKTKFFDNLSDAARDIPVLSKVFKDFQTASDAARKAASEGGSGLLAGGAALGGAAIKGLGGLGMSMAVKGVKDLDERITSLSRTTNMSRESAEKLVLAYNETARSITGLTGKELQAASENLSRSLGTTAAFTGDITEELATQVKFLGLSAEEANKLATFTLATDQNLKEAGNELRGEVILSNARNKTAIDYKAITKDVANSSSAIKISTQASGKSLAQAAIEAKKLGLNLSSVDKIANSLLQFESSISAELEAELLTGKQINLEQARLFALNNDTAGVAREIAKQGVDIASFGKMNRIQQEAIAAAIGMSREELADSLLEQKALTNLGAQNKEELSEKVKLELQNIDLLKKQGKLGEAEAARKKLINNLGNDTLLQQQENRNLTELQAEAAQKIIEGFDYLKDILEPIRKVFQFIIDNARTLAIILGGIAILNISKGVLSLISNLKIARSEATSLNNTMSGGGKGGRGGRGGRGLGRTAGIAGVTGGAAYLGQSMIDDENSAASKTLGVLGATASGVALGAQFGGIYGAIGGGILGLGYGLYNEFSGPKMATGGIVTKPITNATIGEAGREAVIPLDSPQGKDILGINYDKLGQVMSKVNIYPVIYLDGKKVSDIVVGNTNRSAVAIQ
jgi:hypothetical protein